MNLPNKLTLLRVFMIPLFMVLATGTWNGFGSPKMLLAAGIVFALASLTDFFDGHIARKYNLVTDFGKFADPLADKLLTTVAFIYMVKGSVCSPVVLSIILAREFAVSGVRMIAAGAPGGKVIAANMWGKVKTALQMVTIVFYYVAIGLVEAGSAASMTVDNITRVLCWVIAAVTAVSGIQYIWGNRHFINTAK